MTSSLWKVGALAKRTGITVRTLHHYDQIGLLQPAATTAAGHRLYDTASIGKLQQITSLRQLGFSLAEIDRLLNSDEMPPAQIINLHLQRLREQLAKQQGLVARLESLAASLSRHQQPQTESLLDIIQETLNMEKYYTPDQLETLQKRRKAMGDSALRHAENQWRALISAVRQAMEAGTDPTEASLRPLIAQWQELIRQFTGGDRGIENALGNFHRDNPSHMQKQGMSLDQDLFAYMAQAIAAQKDGDDPPQ